MGLVIAVVIAAIGALWLTRRPKEKPAPGPTLSERLGTLAHRIRQIVTLVVVVWIAAALSDGCDEPRGNGGEVERVPCTAFHEEDCPPVGTTVGPAGPVPPTSVP